jgi:hypothetical protein
LPDECELLLEEPLPDALEPEPPLLEDAPPRAPALPEPPALAPCDSPPAGRDPDAPEERSLLPDDRGWALPPYDLGSPVLPTLPPLYEGGWLPEPASLRGR